MSQNKTYILFGLTGSGKSTTSNSIINKSGEQIKLQTPFTTSDGASGCTLHFQVNMTPEETVLDTVGFGDPQFKPSIIFEEFKRALERTGNRVTHVIFVVRKGRFSNELVQFFKSVQEKVLKDKCRYNSIVLITDAPKGWVKNQTDEYIKKAIDNCNKQYFEYSLRFDTEEDDEDDRMRNLARRQKAVDELLKYLKDLNFNEIDLSHVQTAKFEDEFKNDIVPEMVLIISDMMNKMQENNDKILRQSQDILAESKHQNEMIMRQNQELMMQLQRQMAETQNMMQESNNSSYEEEITSLKQKIDNLSDKMNSNQDQGSSDSDSSCIIL